MNHDATRTDIPADGAILGYGPMLPLVAAGIGAWLLPPPWPFWATHLGIIWGAHPIWIVFDDPDVANAAWWLQRIELAFPVRAAARLRTALFFTEARSWGKRVFRFEKGLISPKKFA